MGLYSSDSVEVRRGTTGIVVSTTNVANTLVLRLLEGKDIGLLSCLILDELHLVGDGQRGYVTELLLNKLHFAAVPGQVCNWCADCLHHKRRQEPHAGACGRAGG